MNVIITSRAIVVMLTYCHTLDVILSCAIMSYMIITINVYFRMLLLPTAENAHLFKVEFIITIMGLNVYF
jgi:hypothetical protein